MSKGSFSPVTEGHKGHCGAVITPHGNRGTFIPVVEGEGNDCDRPAGGDMTALPPGYVLQVKNPPTPGLDRSCLWQDDNGIIVQENTGETICIDNV